MMRKRALLHKRKPTPRAFSFNLRDRNKENNSDELKSTVEEKSQMHHDSKEKTLRETQIHEELEISEQLQKNSFRKYATRSTTRMQDDDTKISETENTPVQARIKITARNLAKNFRSSSGKSKDGSPVDQLNISSTDLSDKNKDELHKDKVINISNASGIESGMQKPNSSSKSFSPEVFDLKETSKQKVQIGPLVQLIDISKEKEVIDKSVSSVSSSSNKNLEIKNESRKKMVDKSIELVHQNLSKPSQSFGSKQIFSQSKKRMKFSGIQSTSGELESQRHSDESYLKGDKELTFKPIQIKHFALPSRVLHKVKKKELFFRKRIYEVEILPAAKRSNIHFRNVKPPSQKKPAVPVPEDIEVLMFKPPGKHRSSVEVTDLEVCLTVIQKAFRDARESTTDSSQLHYLTQYQQNIADDVTSMISKLVNLKQKDKTISKVEKNVKAISNEIGEVIDQMILKRKAKSHLNLNDQKL